MAVLQCPNDLVVTRSRMCRSRDAACTTDEQCNADSACWNGYCARHTSHWRLDAFADLALGFSGHWKGSRNEWFSTDLGWGFTARFLKGMSQRWDWGAYLGYLSILGARDYIDPMDATTRYAIPTRLFRAGGLVRIAMVTGPGFRMGIAGEMGLIVFRGAAPGGLEGAVDLFVDFPVTTGHHRLVATVAIGGRGSVAFKDESPNLYSVKYQTETWMASPMLRVGLGFGR